MTVKDYTKELKILEEAADAAVRATNEYNGGWYPCGFAWVTVKPARGPLIAAMKHFKIGDRGYDGGYIIYNPSGSSTQSMEAKALGANAYAEILKKHYGEKYKITVETRVD